MGLKNADARAQAEKRKIIYGHASELKQLKKEIMSNTQRGAESRFALVPG